VKRQKKGRQASRQQTAGSRQQAGRQTRPEIIKVSPEILLTFKCCTVQRYSTVKQ